MTFVPLYSSPGYSHNDLYLCLCLFPSVVPDSYVTRQLLDSIPTKLSTQFIAPFPMPPQHMKSWHCALCNSFGKIFYTLNLSSEHVFTFLL